MREIKFSYVYQHDDTGRILIKKFDIHEIELELMGECFIEGYTLIARRQYTGLKDKNGIEIYEYMEIDGNFEVSFKDGSYVLINISNGDIILLYNYLKDKNGQVTVTKEYTKI